MHVQHITKRSCPVFEGDSRDFARSETKRSLQQLVYSRDSTRTSFHGVMVLSGRLRPVASCTVSEHTPDHSVGNYFGTVTGYNRMIRVFDVSEPGRSFEARPTCKTRKSPVGQRGIISALAFSPDPSGGGMFAAGSYARTICLYSANRCVTRGRIISTYLARV